MQFKQKKVVLKSFQQLIRLPLSFAHGGFTRPQRTKKSGIVYRYCPLTCPPGILSLQGEEHNASESPSPLRGKVGEARMRGYQLGFTLIEILMVVLIIGILGAIMLPQYQRAVLKSRFAALMPIAKSMADSNEAFYLEHGEYADNAEDLPVQGRMNYTDGTTLEFGTTSEYSYVLATRNNDFPNNYIVYQKHSTNYPGEIHCEADSTNDMAQEVCKSFGPTQDIGETLTPNYLTYVLFGTGNGVAPAEPQGPVCEGAACDEQGNITECASGLTLNNGSCEDCATAFPGASACSASDYKATSCNEGYNLTSEGTCVEKPKKMTAAQAQAIADEKCLNSSYGCDAIANEDGTVTVCERTGSVKNGKCYYKTGAPFATVYSADGTKLQESKCLDYDLGACDRVQLFTYNSDGSYMARNTMCGRGVDMSSDLICSRGTYSGSVYQETTYDSQGNVLSDNLNCSVANINEYGICEQFGLMLEYKGNQYRSCAEIEGRTCNRWGSWHS